jgi:transcription elongation GreA/GreB family factor
VSRAFVKEPDGPEAEPELPELAVSTHRNLVTPAGLAQIESEQRRLRELLSAARAAADHGSAARHARDLRYWDRRRATAEVVPDAPAAERVRFGSRVALRTTDGRTIVFRIVGEDEAAPANGRISYVAPLAAAMLGGEVGETVPLGDGEAEIIEIA